MKSNTKSKIIILFILGIIFGLTPFNFTNTNFSAGNNGSSSEYCDEIYSDSINLKISAISGKIHINNNWSAAKIALNFTGNGTYSEPYIIEDWVIDANNTGSGILIENSNVYFRIENCTVYNSIGYKNAGIKLDNITNSQLVNNNCSSNYNGIYVHNSKNNTVSGNTVEINAEYGIILYDSDKNTVSGNDVSNNLYGIDLYDSDNNTVSGNSADINNIYGIHLSHSNYNNASGNTAIYNGVIGIYLYNSHNNSLSGNTANNNLYGINIISSHNNSLSGNNANDNLYGISFSSSYNNPLSGNNANDNDKYGIYLSDSDYNIVSGNNANGNDDGIYLSDSDYNTVSGNSANGNDDGINLYYSDYNTVSGNIVNNNDDGINLYHSDYNDIIENNASHNSNGIFLRYSDNNIVSENNLIYNYECWREYNCEGNVFENNDCEDRSYPSGYIGPYLLSILIGVTTFIGIVILIRGLNNRGFFLKRKYRGLKYVPNKPLQQAPQRTINRTNFCKNCGTPVITKEDLFCSNCGQNLK